MPLALDRRTKLLVLGLGLPVLSKVKNIPSWLLTYPMQEVDGAVSVASNIDVLTGRAVNGLAFADYAGAAEWTDLGSDVAHCDGSQTTTTNFTQTFVLAAGKTYQTTYTISNYSAGAVKIVLGAGSSGVQRDADGTYIETILSTGGGSLIFQGTSAWVGDIDLKIVLIQQTNILADTAFPGDELLNEAGASGTATAANWTPLANAKLENLVVGELRVTRDGSNNPFCSQNVLTTGVRYGTGQLQAKSDGNAIPYVYIGGVSVDWIGVNTHTDWQDVNIEDVADGVNVYLQALTATGTEYCEFRNISAKPANPMNGDDVGTTPGTPGDAPVTYMKTYDGLAASTDATSAEHNSVYVPTQFTKSVTFRKSVWDTTERYLFHDYVDANNYIAIRTTTTAGQLGFDYMAGGTLEQVLFAVESTTDTAIAGISVKANVMKAWFATAQVGSNQAVAGTFVGNFTSQTIGAEQDLTNIHLGDLAYVNLFSDELTPTEWENLAQSMNIHAISGFDDGFSNGFGA